MTLTSICRQLIRYFLLNIASFKSESTGHAFVRGIPSTVQPSISRQHREAEIALADAGFSSRKGRVQNKQDFIKAAINRAVHLQEGLLTEL